ncbi:MAG: sodium:proton antiporter [Prevotella sp.]|nr:sodium:proton antiporter [Prevotella sp.]MBQ8058937.1 sodium:proton antiporter [Prevotella sp.]
MTILITSILIISLLFIATERQTNINKAAVAVFACTLGWVLYICFGSDFVESRHLYDYTAFLNGIKPNSEAVKLYIAKNVFLPYVGRAAEIVLFLLATMSIVEILNNNGCFDFLMLWIRTRRSKLLLWKLTAFAFVMSANLDNISTIVLMLTVTNAILPRTKDRMIYGSMVLVAVIFGGALTVIGDPTGLALWNKGAITASDYTLSMLLPCLVAWALPTFIVSMKINNTIEIEHPSLPYRGDDTNLNVWQRLILFFVGIGGLWLIPTFHDITKLPPFLGALCVLSLLWIVNELINRNILTAYRKLISRSPQRMQYNMTQQILYIVGVILALGVVTETGSIAWFSEQIDNLIGNIWAIGVITSLISTVLDSFASCMTMVSLHDISATDPYYAIGGAYWKVLSFGTAIGGSILGIGSISGIVMMQMQGVTLKWYIKHITPLTIFAGILAFSILCLQLTIL